MLATKNAPDSLRELLDSAETEDDIAAAEELLDEIEAKAKPTNGHSDADRWVVGTLAEVAEFFKVSVGAVRQWRADIPPMPGESFGKQGGRYDLREIVEWRQPRHHDRRPNAKRQETSQALDEIKLERLRMELAQDQGKLVELASVELTFAQALIKCRCQIMTIPEAIATSAPPDIRDHARAEADRTCRAALTTLRRELESPKFVEEGEVKS